MTPEEWVCPASFESAIGSSATDSTFHHPRLLPDMWFVEDPTAGRLFVEDLTMDGPSSAIVHLTTAGPLFGVDPIMTDGRSPTGLLRDEELLRLPHLTGGRRLHPQSSGAVV